jgi:hypothetical protein
MPNLPTARNKGLFRRLSPREFARVETEIATEARLLVDALIEIDSLMDVEQPRSSYDEARIVAALRRVRRLPQEPTAR